MSRSEILESLYVMLPNREADSMIDAVLAGEPDSISRAERFLRSGVDIPEVPSLFVGLERKPVYRSVERFMAGGFADDDISIMKMLSSLVTQALIQSELRGVPSSVYGIGDILSLISDISVNGDCLTDGMLERARAIVNSLGWGSEIPGTEEFDGD